MNTNLILALLTLLSTSTVFLFNYESQGGLQLSEQTDLYEQYTQWKIKFNKFTNDDEYRFQVFSDNYNFVQKHNNNRVNDAVLGMTQFADLTNQEFKEKMTTNYISSEYARNTKTLNASDVPSSVNWVQKGAVTDVKNQGDCGGCWAFAATAALEGQQAVSTGTLESLSPQQLISCMTPPFSLGCGGGNPIFAYSYTKNNGIETWASYPYVQEKDTTEAPCTYDSSKVVFQNKGSVSVPEQQPEQMKAALAQQPISIGINGGSIYFQLYNGGILNNTSCTADLDHAIAVVGYDATGSTPYWTVKNSWGTGWGEKGYAQIAITEGSGVCGINMDPAYPTY